jgi:hypothetical protein
MWISPTDSYQKIAVLKMGEEDISIPVVPPAAGV